MGKEMPLDGQVTHIAKIRNETPEEIREAILNMHLNGISKDEIYRQLTANFGTGKSHLSQYILSVHGNRLDEPKDGFPHKRSRRKVKNQKIR